MGQNFRFVRTKTMRLAWLVRNSNCDSTFWLFKSLLASPSSTFCSRLAQWKRRCDPHYGRRNGNCPRRSSKGVQRYAVRIKSRVHIRTSHRRIVRPPPPIPSILYMIYLYLCLDLRIQLSSIPLYLGIRNSFRNIPMHCRIWLQAHVSFYPSYLDSYSLKKLMN